MDVNCDRQGEVRTWKGGQMRAVTYDIFGDDQGLLTINPNSPLINTFVDYWTNTCAGLVIVKF